MNTVTTITIVAIMITLAFVAAIDNFALIKAFAIPDSIQTQKSLAYSGSCVYPPAPPGNTFPICD